MDEFKKGYNSVLNNDTFNPNNRGARVPAYRKILSPYFTFKDGNVRTKKNDNIEGKSELVKLRIAMVELALDFSIYRKKINDDNLYANYVPDKDTFDPSDYKHALRLASIIRSKVNDLEIVEEDKVFCKQVQQCNSSGGYKRSRRRKTKSRCRRKTKRRRR